MNESSRNSDHSVAEAVLYIVLQYHVSGFTRLAFHMLFFLFYMQYLSFALVSGCRRECFSQDEFNGKEFDNIVLNL